MSTAPVRLTWRFEWREFRLGLLRARIAFHNKLLGHHHRDVHL